MGAYGVGNLELLARAHVARLGDGRLQATEGPVVQSLYANNTYQQPSVRPVVPFSSGCLVSYLRAGNRHLDLAAGGAHELGELAHDRGQQAEAVVLGEGGEEVLDVGVALDARDLEELADDGALVGGRELRGAEEGGELGVLFEDGADRGEGAGRGLERRRLDGGRVL